MGKHKPTTRLSLLKELFSLPKKKTEKPYFDHLASQVVILRCQLDKIERRYYSSHESHSVVPENIRQEREELLRKISLYSNQVGRAYDRWYARTVAFWYQIFFK